MATSFPSRGVRIDVSYGTFLKLAVLLLAAGFLYLVRELLLLIFVALVIASAVDPLVDRLHQKRIPRALTVLLVFAVLLSVVGFVVSALVPLIAEQFQQLVQLLPGYLETLANHLAALLHISPSDLVSSDVLTSISARAGGGSLTGVTTGVTTAVTGLFRGVVSFVIILVLSFYFVVQQDGFRAFIRSILPVRHQTYVSDLTGRIQGQMGLWLRGQLILAFIIFVLTYILLLVLHVPNPLVLALLAGLLEVVPYIGPIVSALPIALVALTISPLTALLALAGCVLIQQLENHLLQPRVMGKVLGLNPLLVIIALLVGAKLAGVLGAVLAVPLTTALTVFISDLFEERESLEERLYKPVSRDVRFFRPKPSTEENADEDDDTL